jgi:hypothetical protein
MIPFVESIVTGFLLVVLFICIAVILHVSKKVMKTPPTTRLTTDHTDRRIHRI